VLSGFVPTQEAEGTLGAEPLAFRSAMVNRVFSYRSPGLRSSERNDVDVQTDFLIFDLLMIQYLFQLSGYHCASSYTLVVA